MTILKRKWPLLLACTLSLALVLSGYASLQSVKTYRKTSTSYPAVITALNPLNIRWSKEKEKTWIGIAYTDANGNRKSALAHARDASDRNVGDPVVAYFGKGKVSATLADWEDWVPGTVLIVLGAWVLGIGLLIRNILGSSNSAKRKSSRKASEPPPPLGKMQFRLTLAMAAIGIACLLASAGLFAYEIQFKRYAVDLYGVVVDTRGFVYRYEYPPGTPHRVIPKSFSSEWSFIEGDSIAIQVDTRNPSRAQIRSFTDQWLAPSGMAMFGVVFGAFGFGVLAARKGRPILKGDNPA